MNRQTLSTNSPGLSEIRAHLDKIGIELYNGSRMVELQITHVAGIGVVFGWPTWRSPGHRKQDLERHVKKLGELESANHQPIWFRGKTNLASTRKLYGIKWVDKVGWNPFPCEEKSKTINKKPESGQFTRNIHPLTTQKVEPVIYSRCLVIEEVSEDESVVCFIDYGDCALIKNSELFELESEYAAIPLICRAFVLYEMPLKILPLPSKIAKKSLFNNTRYQHLLKWLENNLINKVVEVVPTRDLQKVLSNGKIRSYINESGDFGVLLITFNGININDEFKREIERAKEIFGSECKYEDSSSEGSIHDDQLPYLQAEEDSKMLDSLCRLQEEHKLKRKAFLWKSNQADKLLDFAKSVHKTFAISGYEGTKSYAKFWVDNFNESIKLLKHNSALIENINECLLIKNSFIKLENTDTDNENLSKHYQNAIASITAVQCRILKTIDATHDLTKIETELLNKLSDLESLNDQWKESFGFINSQNDVEALTSGEQISLESVIAMMETWSIEQKNVLRASFDKTRTIVKEFSQEQCTLQKIRLRQRTSEKTQKEPSLHEYQFLLDSVTTISETN